MDQIEIKGKIKTAQINNALGFFICFFGIVVSFAMIYSEAFTQQMTCLVSGLALIIIGGGMMLYSRKTIKSLQS